MNIKVPQGSKIVSHPLLNVNFSFASDLGDRLDGFFGIGGDFQKTIDQTFMDAMIPYMPFDTGTMTRLTREQTEIGSGIITTDTPGARMLYYGLLMVDSITGSAWSPLGGTKVVTDIPLQFHGGAKTGAFWDRRMMAEQGDNLIANWQRYVEQNF